MFWKTSGTFWAAEPVTAPTAWYFRATLLAAATPAFMAASFTSSAVAPLAAWATAAFSAAILAAATAPRPAIAAAPPVNRLGKSDGITSPTASTANVPKSPRSLIFLYEPTAAG